MTGTLHKMTLVTKADSIVICVAVLMLPWLYSHFWGDGSQGESARIQVAGQAPLLIPLQRSQRYTIDGPLGTSIIEVQDGRIRFAKSPCRNQLCVHSGWLQRDAEFTACLPNLISITVSGRNPRFDSINF
jgi:hypothetical protein